MTPNRWQEVKEIFRSALEIDPPRRAAFLGQACAGDDSLRREVESLIRSHEESISFMEKPAVENKDAAETLVNDQPQLAAGQRVGHYEIITLLGEGGMGEVYLAEDTKLGRKVALKFLPAYFTKDAERLRRFEQEARSASALNHPNIITIYEIREVDSTLMIATEFVEGETLRQRVAHDRLNLNEALNVAIQVADALAAAHKAGIIHRDIKPENIMIRPDALVKVLDFGLAKLTEPTSATAIAEAPTKRVKTGSGVVMGTVGYMSPEQARGQVVDARSDIFNLGAVIYEMVAGQKPFEGETPSDVLAAILKSEPPLLSHFTPEASPELVRIVGKALRKDREQRYQVVRDLLLDLKSLKEELEFQVKLDRSAAPSKTGESSAAISQSQRLATGKTPASTDEIKTAVSTITHSLGAEIKRHKLAAIFIATSLALAIIIGAVALRREPISTPTSPNATVSRTTQFTTSSGLDLSASFSPDGSSIAYSSDRSRAFEIYIKSLAPGGGEIQLTSDGEQNLEPAWSLDGKMIAYYSWRRGGVWVVPALGGTPRQLTDFGSQPAWSPDSTLIAFQSDNVRDLGASSPPAQPPSTLWVVSLEGGALKQITQVGDPTGGHGSPSWSPDASRIVFSTDLAVWTISSKGGDLKRASPDMGQVFGAVYAPDGKNVYYSAWTKDFYFGLWQQRISPNGDVIGEPQPVANTGSATGKFLTISADGKKLAYSAVLTRSNLWSIPIAQSSSAPAGPPVQITSGTNLRNALPAISPDGRKIAFVIWRTGTDGHLWLTDADGKNPRQLTTDSANHQFPSWLPDGNEVSYSSAAAGTTNVKSVIKAISLRSGKDRVIFDPRQAIGFPKLSPDGKSLAFNAAQSGTINIWIGSVETGQSKQLTFDKEMMGFPSWSPDGQLLAFEIKRGDDNYLAVMPSTGGEPTQLTFEHGLSWPNGWSPDGDKIVFAGQRNGIWNIYWVSRTTKEQKQLTHYSKLDEFVRYPAWSPLGIQIVYEYAETTGNIWLMELK